ncbi:MAG: ABC transporter substrate-binding protein [Actinomycetota bacterium]|nr:ABC transporter substrate-binding protein [Actinomycetota bacterium]
MEMKIGSASVRRRWGKGRIAVLGVASAAVLAACGSSSSSSTTTTAATSSSSASSGASGTPYVMHAILSQTGSASFLGSREAKALQGLAALVNTQGGIDGHPLQIDLQDNQSTPSTAVSYATSLVSSNVPLIFNGSVVAVDASVDALATSNGPFIYDLSPGTHPKPGSMVFSAGISTKFDAQAYLTFLKAKGLTNIAAITSTDGSGVDGFNQLKTALAEPQFSSFKLLTHQTFDPTAVSVTAQLSVIKAQNPQALIIWTTGTPLGTVLQGMSSLGMSSIPTVTTDGNAAYSELTHFSSILPKTLYFPTGMLYLPPSDITNAAVKAKVQAFDTVVQAAGGHPGDAWGLSWDPAQLLIGAIEKLGVNATAPQILNYMENLHNVAGVFGIYNTSTSDHRGLSVQDVTITKWNGSSFTPVSALGGAPLAGG